MITNEVNNELSVIKEMEYTIIGKHLKYKTNRRIFNFKKGKTIRSLGEDIVRGKITISKIDEKQSNFLINNLEFNYKARPKLEPYKRKREMLMKVEMPFTKVVKHRIFLTKPTQGKGRPSNLAHVAKFSDHFCLKIPTFKQMLKRLPIAFLQI